MPNLTLEDIKLIADLIKENRIPWPIWVFFGLILFTILILFLWDRLFFFKKNKEILEERLKLARDKCDNEKKIMEAKYEAIISELKVKFNQGQLQSVIQGGELSEQWLYKKKPEEVRKEFLRLLAAGTQYESEKRYDLAVDCYEDALKKIPDDIYTYVRLSVIFGEKIGAKEGKEKAIEYCNKILQKDPNNVVAKFNSAIYTNHLKGSTHSLPLYGEAESLIKLQGLVDSEIYGKLNIFIGHDFKNTGNKPEAKIRYKNAITILSKLSQQGDLSSAFWLDNAKHSLEILENEEG